MLYRPLGRTGRTVSAIGFGGMRFKTIDDRDACCATLERAAALGINYFDTAPGYFGVRSELRFGEGLQGKNVLISTKSSAVTGAVLRRDLEASLKRLRRDRVDVFHIWYVLTPAEYARRRKGGAVAAAFQARAEGLVGEVFLSTHMDGREIGPILEADGYAGVTLGFSAVNAPFRMPAVEAARRLGVAVLCMNPLGGGLIPRNPRYFGFLKSAADRSVIVGALRYILSVEGVTLALVGCEDERQVEEAAAAVTPFKPWSARRRAGLQRRLTAELDRVCTGCNYCAGCPAHIAIPKLMMSYNLKVLGEADQAIQTAMKYDWNLSFSQAAQCTACGACEVKCTQKLPIIERLKYMAHLNNL